jgi:hypothetical protein
VKTAIATSHARQERMAAAFQRLRTKEESDMQSCTAFGMAMAVGIAAALSPVDSAWAASETRLKLAMPTAPEETVYRPECPSDEVSSAWLSCQVAHADGNRNQR